MDILFNCEICKKGKSYKIHESFNKIIKFINQYSIRNIFKIVHNTVSNLLTNN